ncbi:hypothetical protein [Haloarcula sp. CGMCC 1.6347]|uniref:hypothetical protein n=1 Tax=Haloarcula sp. CGMCC 1.6347 TaxID=3111455 RepID=UPI00300F5521
MEIEIPDEGGYVDLEMGGKSTIKVESAEPEQIRISIKSRSSGGEMRLGVGLSPGQAKDLGDYLIAQAKIVEDREEEE